MRVLDKEFFHPAFKAAAVAAGESMNQYIITAVDERMERDNSTTSAQEGQK